MSISLSAADLRPLNTGQILDTSLRLYRRNFWTYLGIVALLQLPLLLLTVVTLRASLAPINFLLGDPTASAPALGFFPWASFLSNGTSIVTTFLAYFISAALSMAVARSLLGAQTTLRQAYGYVRRRFVDILIFAVLALALTLVLGVLTMIGTITCVGLFVGLGAVMAAGIILQLGIPVMMLEQIGPWQALVRAWNMYRRRFWPVTWTGLAAALFVYVVLIGIQAVVLSVFGLIYVDQFQESIDNLPVTGIALVTFASSVVALFATPVTMAAMTVLYFDLRVRQDGVDIALAALDTANGSTPTADADALALLARTPATPNDPALARWSEFRPLLLLGLLPFGFVAALFALFFLIFFLFGLFAL